MAIVYMLVQNFRTFIGGTIRIECSVFEEPSGTSSIMGWIRGYPKSRRRLQVLLIPFPPGTLRISWQETDLSMVVTQLQEARIAGRGQSRAEHRQPVYKREEWGCSNIPWVSVFVHGNFLLYRQSYSPIRFNAPPRGVSLAWKRRSWPRSHKECDKGVEWEGYTSILSLCMVSPKLTLSLRLLLLANLLLRVQDHFRDDRWYVTCNPFIPNKTSGALASYHTKRQEVI